MMNNRALITRIFYLFALVALGKAYLFQMFPHQLQSPVLVNPMADNTYWMFYVSNIPQLLLANQIVAIIFECILVLSAALSFINTKNVVLPSHTIGSRGRVYQGISGYIRVYPTPPIP